MESIASDVQLKDYVEHVLTVFDWSGWNYVWIRLLDVARFCIIRGFPTSIITNATYSCIKSLFE